MPTTKLWLIETNSKAKEHANRYTIVKLENIGVGVLTVRLPQHSSHVNCMLVVDWSEPVSGLIVEFSIWLSASVLSKLQTEVSRY